MAVTPARRPSASMTVSFADPLFSGPSHRKASFTAHDISPISPSKASPVRPSSPIPLRFAATKVESQPLRTPPRFWPPPTARSSLVAHSFASDSPTLLHSMHEAKSLGVKDPRAQVRDEPLFSNFALINRPRARFRFKLGLHMCMLSFVSMKRCRRQV